jgi:hypothetical protein
MGFFTIAGGRSPVPVVKITGELTASGQAVGGKCVFYGIIIQTDGVNNVTFSVYHGTDATGDPLVPENSVVEGGSRLAAIGYAAGIACPNGIYLSISGTGGKAQILYDN